MYIINCDSWVEVPTSTKDKVNSQYISECNSHLANPHLTSQFCEIELDLKFTFNIIL